MRRRNLRLAVSLMLAVFCLGLGSRVHAAEVEDDGEDVYAEFEEEFAGEPDGYPDPFEAINRATFGLNTAIDHLLIDPGVRVYRFFLPNPVRRAVARVFTNLNAANVIANDVLQGEAKDATVMLTRFVVNTTFGVGGLFDAAVPLGLQRHDNDFGRTMACAGVPSGPYLVLPLLGPSTLRDGIGSLAGVLLRPTTYILGPGDQFFFDGLYGGGWGLVLRDRYGRSLEMLEESSVDFYAAVRNAYYQSRSADTGD